MEKIAFLAGFVLVSATIFVVDKLLRSAKNQHAVLHVISPLDCISSPAGCMESAQSAVCYQADEMHAQSA